MKPLHTLLLLLVTSLAHAEAPIASALAVHAPETGGGLAVLAARHLNDGADAVPVDLLMPIGPLRQGYLEVQLIDDSGAVVSVATAYPHADPGRRLSVLVPRPRAVPPGAVFTVRAVGLWRQGSGETLELVDDSKLQVRFGAGRGCAGPLRYETVPTGIRYAEKGSDPWRDLLPGEEASVEEWIRRIRVACDAGSLYSATVTGWSSMKPSHAPGNEKLALDRGRGMADRLLDGLGTACDDLPTHEWLIARGGGATTRFGPEHASNQVVVLELGLCGP